MILKEKNRKLVLEDGTEFAGYGFGANTDKVLVAVFNTGVVGYQETISDPSYLDHMVIMTYPVIGNYGVTDEDYENKILGAGGLAVREYNDRPSNFRYTKTLSETMEENDIPGIEGIDTRMLTRKIRDKGSCRVLITSIDTPKEEAINIIKNTEERHDQVQRVSSKKRWYSRTANAEYNVVAIDCGIKMNIIRCLNKRGCNVTVVPYDTDAATIENMKPDGIIVSNGPGSPEDIPEVVETVNALKGKYPMFGIALGNLIMGMAYGAKIKTQKTFHSGGNHPVRNLENGKLEIVSQSHGYTIDEDSIKNTDLKITYKDIIEETVQGVSVENDRLFSVQFHPESAPGPTDAVHLFDKFVNMMKEGKENA